MFVPHVLVSFRGAGRWMSFPLDSARQLFVIVFSHAKLSKSADGRNGQTLVRY